MPSSYVVVEVRPLRAWPGAVTPAEARRSDKQFKATPGATLAELEEELARQRARDAFLEVDVRSARDVRNDGRLRSDAVLNSPGVVLYFTEPHAGDLRFACDRYKRWDHNVRAILLTLQALRAVDRWGAVQDGQQFTGFRALPSGIGLGMGSSAAVEIFETATGEKAEPRTPERLIELYRRARARWHPDRPEGDRARFDQVQAAARVLGVS